MRKKMSIVALVTVFLLQTQAWAAIENESEILGGNAKRSVPTKQNDKNGDAGNFSFGGDSEPQVVSEADRQKEILATNARRSVAIVTEKDKGSSSKNKRVRNGVIIEDKKDSSAERSKIETRQKNKEESAKALEESRIVSDSDWQREILSGNAKRSVNMKRQNDDDKVEIKSKNDNSKVIRNGVIIEPKKNQNPPDTFEKTAGAQSEKQNIWPETDWQREILSNNAKTSLPVQQDGSAARKADADPNEVVRNGVIVQSAALENAVPKQETMPREPILAREHVVLVPSGSETSGSEEQGATRRVERNGVVFILKDEAPTAAKEEKKAAAEDKKAAEVKGEKTSA